LHSKRLIVCGKPQMAMGGFGSPCCQSGPQGITSETDAQQSQGSCPWVLYRIISLSDIEIVQARLASRILLRVIGPM
jgi:hypothetical protein